MSEEIRMSYYDKQAAHLNEAIQDTPYKDSVKRLLKRFINWGDIQEDLQPNLPPQPEELP